MAEDHQHKPPPGAHHPDHIERQATSALDEDIGVVEQHPKDNRKASRYILRGAAKVGTKLFGIALENKRRFFEIAVLLKDTCRGDKRQAFVRCLRHHQLVAHVIKNYRIDRHKRTTFVLINATDAVLQRSHRRALLEAWLHGDDVKTSVPNVDAEHPLSPADILWCLSYHLRHIPELDWNCIERLVPLHNDKQNDEMMSELFKGHRSDEDGGGVMGRAAVSAALRTRSKSTEADGGGGGGGGGGDNARRDRLQTSTERDEAAWDVLDAGDMSRKALRCWGRIFLNHDQISDLRDHYGDEIAWYYLFVNHLTQWLVIPAVLGIILFITEVTVVGAYTQGVKNSLRLAYCVLVHFWAALMMRYWVRKEKLTAFVWGVESQGVVDVPRRDFHGKEVFNENLREWVLAYPRWKRYLKYCAAVPVTLLFVFVIMMIAIVCVALEFALFYYRDPNTQKHEFCAIPGFDKIGFLSFLVLAGPSILFALLVEAIIRNLFTCIAESLTRWENHRYQADYEKSLTIKLFSILAFAVFGYFFTVGYLWVPFGEQVVQSEGLGATLFNVTDINPPTNWMKQNCQGMEVLPKCEVKKAFSNISQQDLCRESNTVCRWGAKGQCLCPNTTYTTWWTRTNNLALDSNETRKWDMDQCRTSYRAEAFLRAVADFAYVVQIINLLLKTFLPFLLRRYLCIPFERLAHCFTDKVNHIRGKPDRRDSTRNNSSIQDDVKTASKWSTVQTATALGALGKGAARDRIDTAGEIARNKKPLNRLRHAVKAGVGFHGHKLRVRAKQERKLQAMLGGRDQADSSCSDRSDGRGVMEEDIPVAGIYEEISRPPYDTFDDYADAGIQLAFVTMFSVAFPLLTTLSLFVNVMQIRSNHFRMAYQFSRPMPQRRNGIGAWRVIFQFMVKIGVLANFFLLLIPMNVATTTLQRPEDDETMLTMKVLHMLLIAFAIDRVYILAADVIEGLLPDASDKLRDRKTHLRQKRRKHYIAANQGVVLDHDHKNERKRGRTYISEGRRERHGQVEEPDHHLTNDEQISHIAASVMEHSDRSIDSRRAGDASENQKTDVHGGEEGESKGDGVQVLDPSDTGDSMRGTPSAGKLDLREHTKVYGLIFDEEESSVIAPDPDDSDFSLDPLGTDDGPRQGDVEMV